MADLVLKDVCKSFGNIEVIRGVSLSFEHREFIVFVGPSGCGKSTLLRMIAGLESLSGGEIEIAGVDVANLPPSKRGIAMVFQSYALYPHMNVYKNMAYGLKLARASKAEVKEKVGYAADILQLDQLLYRRPADLSGGQRQRVAIGRAIVRDPKVFLFDEPLSNLDASLRSQMRIEIANLHQRLNATMVYVTHDQVEAMTMADRIVVLNHGIIEQVGKPLDLYHNPCNLFVAGFIGSPKMNFFDGECLGTNEDAVTVSIPAVGQVDIPVRAKPSLVGQKITVGLRPQDCRLGSGKASFHLNVSIVEPLGDQTVAYGVTAKDGKDMTIEVNGTEPVSPRTQHEFSFNPEDCHLFDQDSCACPRLKVPAIVSDSTQ